MTRESFRFGSLVVAATALATWTPAQQPPQFAAPVRLMAGEKLLGVDRLYPSPVAHDVDGDGTLDLVIGDLRGKITVALRTASGYAAEQPMLAADGKDLDFGNW